MTAGKLVTHNHRSECPAAAAPAAEGQQAAQYHSEVDFNDIQGDIIAPFPKRVEDFIFFKIDRADRFRGALTNLLPYITRASNVLERREVINRHKQEKQPGLVDVEFVNIAFTHSGLKALIGNKVDELGDNLFARGQLDHAKELGDRVNRVDEDGNHSWDPIDWRNEYKRSDVHGVLLVASQSREHLNSILDRIRDQVDEIYTVHGKTRPGSLKDHEHFGWKDGISNPFLRGVYHDCSRLPGQRIIDPGVILVGNEGDNHPPSAGGGPRKRPDWAKNGSFMAFRELDQLVPEFHKFLWNNPVQLEIPGWSPARLRRKGAELRGAQFVGRWPNGTPLQRNALEESLNIAENEREVNNFTFKLDDQTFCPFSAHIRKMNPRLDPSEVDGINFDLHSVVRTGIAYGEELLTQEEHSHTRLHRGLAFVCYQSDIGEGFSFQQRAWANNPLFPPPFTGHPDKGLDPLIGQREGRGSIVSTTGIHQGGDQNDVRITTDNQGHEIAVHDFIVPRGGAYFFVPSMSMLEKIASADLAP